MLTIKYRFLALGMAVTAALTIGAGTAAAKEPYVGSTYADAAAKLTQRGYTPVVSTVVGDQLKTEDCIVTASRKATYPKSDNFDHAKDYLLALNCSAPLAHGEPGNSLATPEGLARKKIEQRAAKYNAHPESCAKNLDACKKFCDKNEGVCSKDVISLF